MVILIQKYIYTEQLLVVSVLPNNQLSDGIPFFFHTYFSNLFLILWSTRIFGSPTKEEFRPPDSAASWSVVFSVKFVMKDLRNASHLRVGLFQGQAVQGSVGGALCLSEMLVLWFACA